MITSSPFRIRRLLPALALALLPVGAAAQTAPAPPAAANVVFTGRVLDRASGQPVPGARVEFPREARRAVADSSGAFLLDEISEGDHELIVTASGYTPLAVVVALRPGIPRVNIPLDVAVPDTTAEVDFTGRVLDDRSGTPIHEARIEFVSSGRPVLTDSAGVFILGGVSTGPQMLRVRARGYPARAWLIDVAAGMEPATIRLEPDLVMLEGLTVIADRLEQRRRSSGLSSRAIDANQLALTTAPDMKSFLRQHFGLIETRCGSMGNGADGCVIVRGGPTLPSVLVDDMPQIGGFDVLDLYNPADFDRVEVYGSGRVIALYTLGFIERKARSKTGWMPMNLP